jgi:hypothetical protein
MADSNKKNSKVEVKLFDTLEEAKASRPAGKDKWHVFKVTRPGSSPVYLWADGPGGALIRIARQVGFAVSRSDKQVSKEAVAGYLAGLTDEDRSILIAQYLPASTGKGKK